MAKVKPYFSVVMPVYNREGFVRHAIQSILDQTFSDWELIIVNDGSTDNTEGIIQAYAKQDKRIRYFKNKINKGISYTRNLGNSKALGDIIVVQDSDDMSFPDRLEEIKKMFEAHPHTDILYHWFYIRCYDIRYKLGAMHREIHRCGEYDRQKALSQPYIPGQMAYRKKVAKKCPYRTELRYWDDWGFIVDVTMNDFNFTELRRPVYEYLISNDSVSTTAENSDLRETEAKKMRDFMNKEYKLNVTI